MAIKIPRLLLDPSALTRRGGLLSATRRLQRDLTRGADLIRQTLDAVEATARPKAGRSADGRAARGAVPGFAGGFGEASPADVFDDADGAADDDAASGAFRSQRHTAGGLERRFRLHVPASHDAAPPLVVMLHGCTQNARDFAIGTRMNEAADAAGFVVLYPEQSRQGNQSKCWNWFGAREQQGSGEVAFLADLTRRIIAEQGIDPRRVYVAGLSAGGAMAALWAAEQPTLFAAAAVHSGLPAGAAGNVPDALNAMSKGAKRPRPSTVPTIVFHGDADRTVNPVNGVAAIESVVGANPHTTLVATSRGGTGGARSATTTRYVDPAGRVFAEHWRLHGAGHAWSGGAQAGTYTDPAGIDATAEMLRFFDQHRGPVGR